MSSAGIEPGLLKLNLEINKATLSDEDRRQAKYKLEQLKCFLELSLERPHRHAIQNMIAVLHYRLQEEDLATEVLEAALKTDPNNVNILHDLSFIYDKDYRKDDAKECEMQLKCELDVIGEGTGSLAYGRCLAGKGLAWAFDLHPETKGTTRLDNSTTFYNKALNIAGEKLDVKEKEDWFYYLALGYVRLNNIKKMNEDEAHYKDTFEKAMECTKPNLESEDTQRKSAAWCLLGDLFSQRPPNLTVPPAVINNNNFKPYWIRPERCYLQSLEFDDKNCIALNKLAHLHFGNEKTEDALELLNSSLELKTGITNTYALHMRAQIFRIMFNKQQQRKEQKKGPSPDKKLLQDAQKDLCTCIQYNPYVLDMIHLAEICHKLALKEESSSYDSKGLKEALRWCTKAEKCQDGDIRPELHQRRALILQDLGDHENAVKCFMQAMDCENFNTKYNRNFIYMFNGMLDRYHKSSDKPNHMLQELVYWLDKGLIKYANTKIKVSSFVKRCPNEMMCVAEELSHHSNRKRQLELAKKLVDAFRDTNIPCDKAKLQTIAEDAKKAIDLLPDTAPEPQSPATPKITMKARKTNLKLDTSPDKDIKSLSFDARAKPGNPIFSTQDASETEEKRNSTGIKPQTNVDKQLPRALETNSPCSPTAAVHVSDSVAFTSKDADESVNSEVKHCNLLSSKQSEQSQDNCCVITASGACEENEGAIKVSPDEVAPVSSPIALKESEQAQRQEPRNIEFQHSPIPCQDGILNTSNSFSESKSVLSSTPRSSGNASDLSTVSTPGTANSLYTLKISIQSPDSDSGFGGCCEIPANALCDREIAMAVRKILQNSDLRLSEIGDPPPKAKHAGYKFDFYAIYNPECDDTRDWVYYHLRSQLEEGIDAFKGCIQERDFQAGKAVIKNMADSIDESAKILLIISSGFFDNAWCDEAVTLAMVPGQKHKVIPILLEYVPLPRYLRNLHCEDATKTISWLRIRQHLES